ncbi:heparan-alpha-glucosaminide N-acetyltransferase-like isoform X7 [Ascaphus truei]|uniref:heparan-alpha-glucosaminide N-acetyltransferase-like isoform X7 n=1 Tax=Ascaphus truei TaxID=8439 RepID=UPI003F5A2899
MAVPRAAAFSLLALVVSVRHSAAVNELKFDEALITVSSYLPEPVALLYTSDYCYRCLPQLLLTVPSGTSAHSANATVIISTRFTLTMQVVRGTGNASPVCSWDRLYEEHGHYIILVRSDQNTSAVLCERSEDRSPTNSHIHWAARRDSCKTVTGGPPASSTTVLLQRLRIDKNLRHPNGDVCFPWTPSEVSWRWARVPGVLQRLGFTYFLVALMHTRFSKENLDGEESHQWKAAIRDIVMYWPEWTIIIALETIWLCLTFLLPVPGCPKGYLGPGGIGDYGQYPNCTGGAAGYIDKWLLGAAHIYHYPTCKELYKTTQPFDPEGVLGTINSAVMAFWGLQAGKIILIYRKHPLRILKRFLIWAIFLGIISAILTKCTRDEGFIPVNKNLWSLTFVTTLSCFSFLLLGLMFYVIDVRHWWGGQPFIYPGMNSIFVYVGHSLLGTYFPFNWEIKDWTSHYEFLGQDVLGTALWVFVSYLLYRKKFFLKI